MLELERLRLDRDELLGLEELLLELDDGLELDELLLALGELLELELDGLLELDELLGELLLDELDGLLLLELSEFEELPLGLEPLESDELLLLDVVGLLLDDTSRPLDE